MNEHAAAPKRSTAVSEHEPVSDSLTAHELEIIAYGKAHLAARAFIDRHLFESLDLDAIARAAGYSPSQFSRRFTRLQGESVMAYVRGRRLEVAARRILESPDARLIEIAFDCGFESQEAFTRAFARSFGCAPGQLRSSGVTAPPPRRRRTHVEARSVSERIEDHPALTLVGLRRRFNHTNHGEMAALWERLVELRTPDGCTRRSESFGVFLKQEDDATFEFFAAFRATEGEPPARPLESLTLPPRRYLVFRCELGEGYLLAELNAARDAIAARRAARSERGEGLVFHRYPENFGIRSRWLEHYFPIAVAADQSTVAPRPLRIAR